MANDGEKKFNGIQIGIPSLVLIFAVLCLVIFAILSLLSAISDDKLQQRSREAIQGYYAADAAAEENLQELDAVLLQCKAEATDNAQYKALLGQKLGDMYQPEAETVEYTEKINENLILHVELRVYDINSKKRYEILKWQEENISDCEIDDSLPVWTGEL